jgi:phosphoribosylformylglycinamidine cyclo-ligase
VRAVVDRTTWTPAPIFGLIAETGQVSREQMELTFNLGVGMVAVVPAGRSSDALALAQARGLVAWELGVVRAEDESPYTNQTLADQPGRVEMAGSYPMSPINTGL